MGGMSVFHWLIVLVVVMLLFGAGRLSDVGKGLGEGIKNFKKGLREDEDDAPVVRAKRKVADVSDDDEPVVMKQLPAGKKKKIIQIEVDDDDDEIEVARKVAAKKKAIRDGVEGAEDETA
jgi:sec-independent protein translocase protein TatA